MRPIRLLAFSLGIAAALASSRAGAEALDDMPAPPAPANRVAPKFATPNQQSAPRPGGRGYNGLSLDDTAGKERAPPNSTPGTWDHSYEFRPGKWAQADHDFDLPSPPKTNPGPPDAPGRQFNGFVSRFSAGARASPPLPKAALRTR